MLRQGDNNWNSGLESAEMELPDESTLQVIAEVAVASLETSNKRSCAIKITDTSGKRHPSRKNTAVISFSAQQNATGGGGCNVVPVSVLMKKVDGSSSTELQAYSTLFKDMQPDTARNIHGILQGQRQQGNLYTLIPRPYLIRKPYLFLENVEQGTSGKFNGVHNSLVCNKGNMLNLDFNHCLLAVETLARFHATSYILRKQLGVKGKGKLELLQKYPFLNQQSNSQYSNQASSHLAPVFEQAFNLAVSVIQQENPSLAFKLQRKVINPEGIYEKVVMLLEDERYENDDLYVVCHGNFLADNIIFSYKSDAHNEEPTSCRITNFNSMFLGPVSSDLALFLLTCTNLEFRLEYEEKLLAFYCDAFQEQLVARCGGNSDIVKEFEENIDEFHRKVEKQYKKMMEFAFYNICVLLPLILFTNSSDSTDNNNDIVKNTGECSAIKDLLVESNAKKYFCKDGNASGIHGIESQFENFALNNVILRERLVEILKQFVKFRVVL